jgi:hypothetical protein
MRKKLSFALGIGALTLLMSSCFVLQSFTVLDYTLTPGQGTKVRFTLRPTTESFGATPQFQFVIVGVETGTNMVVGKATWGTNGLFRGPLPMPVSGALVAAMGSPDSACSRNGIDLADITNITWKAFITPQKIGDGNLFDKKAVVEVNIKAGASAPTGENHIVMGVSGEWQDINTDDIVDAGDGFDCSGIASSPVYVLAP